MKSKEKDIFYVDPVTAEYLFGTIKAKAPRNDEMEEGWLASENTGGCGAYYDADFMRRLQIQPNNFEDVLKGFKILLKNIVEANMSIHKRFLALEDKIQKLEEENRNLRQIRGL